MLWHRCRPCHEKGSGVCVKHTVPVLQYCGCATACTATAGARVPLFSSWRRNPFYSHHDLGRATLLCFTLTFLQTRHINLSVSGGLWCSTRGLVLVKEFFSTLRRHACAVPPGQGCRWPQECTKSCVFGHFPQGKGVQ